MRQGQAMYRGLFMLFCGLTLRGLRSATCLRSLSQRFALIVPSCPAVDMLVNNAGQEPAVVCSRLVRVDANTC